MQTASSWRRRVPWTGARPTRRGVPPLYCSGKTRRADSSPFAAAREGSADGGGLTFGLTLAHTHGAVDIGPELVDELHDGGVAPLARPVETGPDNASLVE